MNRVFQYFQQIRVYLKPQGYQQILSVQHRRESQLDPVILNFPQDQEHQVLQPSLDFLLHLPDQLHQWRPVSHLVLVNLNCQQLQHFQALQPDLSRQQLQMDQVIPTHPLLHLLQPHLQHLLHQSHQEDLLHLVFQHFH